MKAYQGLRSSTPDALRAPAGALSPDSHPTGEVGRHQLRKQDHYESTLQRYFVPFTRSRYYVYFWDLIRILTLPHLLYYNCKAVANRYDKAKLILGAGPTNLEGWTSIDGNPLRKSSMWLDLRNRWPFKKDSISVIATSHFLNILFDNELKNVLAQAYRVLRPGGVLRISASSLEVQIENYLSRDDEDRGRDFNSVCHWYGQLHQIFDRTLLRSLLTDAGFAEIRLHSYPESDYLTAAEVKEIDTTPEESLFVECVKPK